MTNQFIDNEARLKNLLLFRDKMKALLDRTSNIEEIVKIEKELRRVQIEIDSIQGQQKYLKDALALTPIRVNFKEKRVYGPLGYIANGI
jgi:seryl-tRNA synthetase